MMRLQFYVCPICGNVIHSMGEAVIHCHGLQMFKLYPEGNAEARFKRNSVRRIFCYCNQEGLFYMDPVVTIQNLLG